MLRSGLSLYGCERTSTNVVQAIRALEVMRDQGFRWHIESIEDYVSVGVYGKLANGKGENKDFTRAVCLALCEAVRNAA
jgi:hypothetical protein